MEQVIILVAIGLLSLLFNKKNKKAPESEQQQPTQQQQMPEQHARPTSAQPQVTRQPHAQQAAPVEQMDPFKRLKEFTSDVYREIQEDQNKASSERVEREKAPTVEISVGNNSTPSQGNPARSKTREQGRSSGRLTTHNPQTTKKKERTVATRVNIKSEQDVLKGIVFSEILGPPKSKQ